MRNDGAEPRWSRPGVTSTGVVRWRQPVVRHPTGSAVSAHVDHELRGMRQPRRVLQLSAVDVLPR